MSPDIKHKFSNLSTCGCQCPERGRPVQPSRRCDRWIVLADHVKRIMGRFVRYLGCREDIHERSRRIVAGYETTHRLVTTAKPAGGHREPATVFDHALTGVDRSNDPSHSS